MGSDIRKQWGFQETKTQKNNVSMTVSWRIGKGCCEVTDIDIPPGVARAVFAVFGFGFSDIPGPNQEAEEVRLRGVKKSFPDVTEIEIGSRMQEVQIDNAMFPNVREIISHSRQFRSGVPYLGKLCSDGLTLKNAFCLIDGETLDATSVTDIAPEAFTGCGAARLINTGTIRCNAEAFPRAMLEDKGGTLMAGGILAGTAENANKITIPADCTCVANYAFDGADIQEADMAAVPGNMTLFLAAQMPPTLRALKINVPDGMAMARSMFFDTIHDFAAGIGRIEIPEGNMSCKSIDGIVYSKDGRELIFCPPGRTGHVDVAPGTKSIKEKAFHSAKISSVSLPDGLVEIKDSAFAFCNIGSVTLPPSLKKIGMGNFNRAREIFIPSGRPIKGLISDLSNPYGRSDFSAPPYITIDMAGGKFVLPTWADHDKLKTFKEAWEGGHFIGHMAESLFLAAKGSHDAEDAAIAQLKLTPQNTAAKKYLKEHAYSAIQHCLDAKTSRDRDIAFLVHMDILGEDMLLGMLDDKRCQGQLKAYILDALETQRKRKKEIEKEQLNL